MTVDRTSAYRAIDSVFVNHPNFARAYADIRDLIELKPTHTAPCIHVSGPSGVGKTTLQKRIRGEYPAEPNGALVRLMGGLTMRADRHRLITLRMPVHTATSLLGTNTCSLRVVVQQGYVRAMSRSVTGKILTVSEADVLQFAERYVFTPKLASECGLSATSVARGLARLEIKPVMRGEQHVHTLWDRSAFELEDLLVRWVTASGELSQQSSLLPF